VVNDVCSQHGVMVGEFTRLCLSCHLDHLDAAGLGSREHERAIRAPAQATRLLPHDETSDRLPAASLQLAIDDPGAMGRCQGEKGEAWRPSG
jgi:hypothetical protein